MRELALHPVAGFVSFGVISESGRFAIRVQMQFVGNACRVTVADRMSIWLAVVETSCQRHLHLSVPKIIARRFKSFGHHQLNRILPATLRAFLTRRVADEENLFLTSSWMFVLMPGSQPLFRRCALTEDSSEKEFGVCGGLLRSNRCCGSGYDRLAPADKEKADLRQLRTHVNRPKSNP
jgi:hypothetical protein